MKFDGIIINITDIKLVNSKKRLHIYNNKNRFNEYLYDNV